MKLSLRYVAETFGLPCDSGGIVTGWSVDSRTLRPGDLFFALQGPNHDGHAYIAEVFAKGAAGVVAERGHGAPGLGVGGRGSVFGLQGLAARGGWGGGVRDSVCALQALAARARRDWAGKVVAVTGSAGKTTTKDVIAEMLAAEIKTSKTEGNLNN